jgi:plasmid stabilization system protein ParE
LSSSPLHCPGFAESHRPSVSRIVARIEQAAEFPESGRVVPEYADASLRELFWREYRIIYRVESDRVVVVAVVHGRRQLTGVIPRE